MRVSSHEARPSQQRVSSVVSFSTTVLSPGDQPVPAAVEISYLVGDRVLEVRSLAEPPVNFMDPHDLAQAIWTMTVGELGHDDVEVFVRASYAGVDVAFRVDEPEFRERAKPARG